MLSVTKNGVTICPVRRNEQGKDFSAADCPRLRAHLENEVEAVNETLASYETIKRFAILTSQFTPESGELTPTMKLRRRVIHSRYGAEIDGLYDS